MNLESLLSGNTPLPAGNGAPQAHPDPSASGAASSTYPHQDPSFPANPPPGPDQPSFQTRPPATDGQLNDLPSARAITTKDYPTSNGGPSNKTPLSNDYLIAFEKRVSAINELDRSLSQTLNLAVLSYEKESLRSVLSASKPLMTNFVDRLTAEEILVGVGEADAASFGPNSANAKEYADLRKRILEEKITALLDEESVASQNSHLAEKQARKTVRTEKRASLAEPADAKRRKIAEPLSYSNHESPEDSAADMVNQSESLSPNGSDKSRTSKENGKLRIKISLKNEAKLAQPSSKANDRASPTKTKELKSVTKQYDNTFVAIWKDLSRKDGPKVARMMQQLNQARLINMKKNAILASREAKRWQMRNNKNQKDLSAKARRTMREMFNFWKRNERIEREVRRKHEKELIDKAKKEEEDREARRQSRKLNFLITQTELYSHFIGKKIKTDEIEGSDADGSLAKSTDLNLDKYHGVEGKQTDFNSLDFDSENEDELHRAAAANAQNALNSAKSKAESFDDFRNPDTNGEEMNFQNPTLVGDLRITQPNMLKCTLKEYQIKGLNWLANLYEQGINGILADEMGLGKTVQSISVLAYLAEAHNIWGPFLVVTPASTLHNWQQEISKFVPEMKVLPYWGNTKDRKILRKFWDRKNMRYGKDSPFHVLVTSYQLVVADAPYFQKMKWQYMILDEAQAIKSSQSSRWKSLLSFSCRNRLLLTGTPIQNSMQELWALLHFIMPSLFDSHDEFSDWFSKDIESHAQSNTQLNEQQLKRLHVILKPFMLRRVKKNVQSELGDKLEIDIFCDLTNRQKKYYQMLKSQISLLDLLSTNNDESSQSLMNLVMQFRKVCNHPDLFERADVYSSLAVGDFAETGSFLRETDLELAYSLKNKISYNLPKLIYHDMLVPGKNNDSGSRQKIYEMFSIYNPENVADDRLDNFGWLKFIDVSEGELNKVSHQSLIDRSIDLKEYTSINYDKLSRIKYVYDDRSYADTNRAFLIKESLSSLCEIQNSTVLSKFYSIQDNVYTDMYMNVLPPAALLSAVAPPIDVICSDYAFTRNLEAALFDSSIKSSLLPLTLSTEAELLKRKVPLSLYPKSNMLPTPVNNWFDYLNIRMPSMNRFVTESGKLAKLDKLLEDLKKNDHRVLLYFQMTKMMDLMEEFLTFKQHSYIRLDGSSKLEDRRDLVHDWQTKPEIFVFLLSTRAGGLGINLTSADTVIFYDSDWNPTIDSQAMDRAHRLGQTKQVTVYRLLTKGTIEERMRDRAKQKEQVQQVVMEGKSSFPAKKKEDATAKKKDVAFLLLGEGEEGGDAPIPTSLEAMYHEGEGDFSGAATPMK